MWYKYRDINVNVVSCTDITHGSELESENYFKKKKIGRSCRTYFFFTAECVMRI